MKSQTIHAPGNPAHKMTLDFPDTVFEASVDGKPFLASNQVMVIHEFGRSAYPPVFYFPLSGVDEGLLEKLLKSTHCPLKGDSSYFDLVVDGERFPETAWSYDKPLPSAKVLAGYVAFDTSLVKIKEK